MSLAVLGSLGMSLAVLGSLGMSLAVLGSLGMSLAMRLYLLEPDVCLLQAPMDTEETVLSEDTPARLEFDSQDSTPPDEQENELEESSENDDDRTPLNP